MENFNLAIDIPVLAVKAVTFPDGILAAFDILRIKIPDTTPRRVFGLSRPENGGKIVYYAAVEQHSDQEAALYNVQPMTIKKGCYRSIYIVDFMKDLQSVGAAFQTLIKTPSIDPQGYCIEIYEGEKDVRCMVKMGEDIDLDQARPEQFR